MAVKIGVFGVAIMAMLSLNAANAQSFDQAAWVAELHAKRASNQMPANSEYWFQPENQANKCEVGLVSNTTLALARVKWFGDCHNGRAHGVGIVVMRYGSPEVLQIVVREYDPASEFITYRRIVVNSAMTEISTGREVSRGDTVAVGTTLQKSAAGNAAITTTRLSCKALECVTQSIDPMTGTTVYTVTGPDPNSYRVSWWEHRANNQLLFSMRALELDGAVRAQKWIVDGVPYDTATDHLSGASGRIAFTNELNSVLAMPFDRYAALTTSIDEAVRLSDSKFAGVQSRFCASSKDPDMQLICDPSSLIPEESEFAAAKAEAEQRWQSLLQQLRSGASSSNAAMAQQAQAQQDMRQQQEQARRSMFQQQEQARLMRERENREALKRGFEALGQAGQAAQQYGQQVINQSGGNQAPQVYTPTLGRPPIVRCRTIGYITTCN